MPDNFEPFLNLCTLFLKLQNIAIQSDNHLQKRLKKCTNKYTIILKSFLRCVWLVGHSAGAHLFSCLLHDRSWFENIAPDHLKRFRGITLISGVYQIEPVLRTSNQEILKFTQYVQQTFIQTFEC